MCLYTIRLYHIQRTIFGEPSPKTIFLKLELKCIYFHLFELKPRLFALKWLAFQFWKMKSTDMHRLFQFDFTFQFCVLSFSMSFLVFILNFVCMHFVSCCYRAIKLSSPKLSNITAFGCILVYAAVILLGLDYSTLPANEKAFPIVCTVSSSIN